MSRLGLSSAPSSQRQRIRISKLAPSFLCGKDITCHQKAGFARPRFVCLDSGHWTLFITKHCVEWQQIKGSSERLWDPSSARAAGVAIDILTSQSSLLLEVYVSQGPGTDHKAILSAFPGPGHDPEPLVAFRGPSHYCSSVQHFIVNIPAAAQRGREDWTVIIIWKWNMIGELCQSQHEWTKNAVSHTLTHTEEHRHILTHMHTRRHLSSTFSSR